MLAKPGQTSRPSAASSWLRSLNAPVGLVLLCFLAFGAVSGLLIWLELTVGAGTAMALIAVHAYTGLVGLPVLVVKTVVGAVSWRRRAIRPRTPPSGRLDHVMTAALVTVVIVLYGSGVTMYANWGVLPGDTLKLLHLWAAITGVPVLTYHLWRFLSRARATVGYAVRSAQEPAVTTGRRHVLLAGVLAVVGWGAVRLGAGSVAALDGQGPNDFPVTLTSGGADQPDPAEWRMRIDGQVQRPLTFSLADLRAGPVQRHRYSLDCVLGWSATRTWGGVPLRDLLGAAGASPELVSVVVRSTTGYQVALLRNQVEDPRTMVTWEVDGVDLTPEHGYPARIMAPDVIGERCLKWIDSVTVIAA